MYDFPEAPESSMMSVNSINHGGIARNGVLKNFSELCNDDHWVHCLSSPS